MKVLFYSGSVGYGHVHRDLAIINELRRRGRDLDVVWLAGEPAATKLKQAGEKVLEASANYQNETVEMEAAVDGLRVSLDNYMVSWNKNWRTNFQKFMAIAEMAAPDLVIGDEPYEVVSGFNYGLDKRPWPFVIMFDWVKFYPSDKGFKSRVIAWMGNSLWVKGVKSPNSADLRLFFGHPDDVPDDSYGLFRPNVRKAWNKINLISVGEAMSFDVGLADQLKKNQRAFGVKEGELFIIGTAGGTNVGKGLLELFAKSYPLLKEKHPELRMVLVAGPRIDPKTVVVPPGVKVMGDVPDLFSALAGCDVALTHGGGGTTMELVALRKPFVYFPYEGHMEQQICVGRRLVRRKAGLRMEASKTNPQQLAEAVEAMIGKSVDYDDCYMDGVRKAADEIGALMDKIKPVT